MFAHKKRRKRQQWWPAERRKRAGFWAEASSDGHVMSYGTLLLVWDSEPPPSPWRSSCERPQRMKETERVQKDDETHNREGEREEKGCHPFQKGGTFWITLPRRKFW